jgi:hypothetical protein
MPLSKFKGIYFISENYRSNSTALDLFRSARIRRLARVILDISVQYGALFP